MRAVAVSAPHRAPVLAELPKPVPGQGELRVRVEYAALNPGDWQAADAVGNGPETVPLPLVVGVDFAGRVDMIGPGDNRFRVGDRVVGRVCEPGPGRGAYAEYVAVHEDSPVTLVPRRLSLRSAAALPTAGTAAAQLLDASGARNGDSLLIIGAAGGVGTFLTQLAAARGMRVVAAVRGNARLGMTALGAALTVDTSAGPETLGPAVRGAHPDGVDVLVDLVAADPTEFGVHVSLVRDGGTALSTRGAASAAGPAAEGPRVVRTDFRLAPGRDSLERLAAAVADGALRVLVDAELPLEKAPDALDRNRAGGARGKTLFAP
ncbi:NADP-dependent oxidoreductase [uncultured Streptomyces sp.]|uniref:NADP-dependent oxidoreductase n=1 Tax=uncultured Streptomyces sp. TaxID=174707 RepID=UPI00260A6560|nr:NADP-dependent oxidoreductase [uncultured Streptomyces sp.]